MIVVTGSARTGTSMVMQTLGFLGYPLVGSLFADESGPRELNPKGYYDVPIAEVKDGIQDSRYRGCGVKLFGDMLAKTPDEFVEKVIVCRRNRDDSCNSLVKWIKANPACHYPATMPFVEAVYDENYRVVSRYCEQHDFPVFDMQFENTIEDPVGCVGAMARFLGVEADLQKAIENIGV